MKWPFIVLALMMFGIAQAQEKHKNWISFTLSPSSTRNTGHFAHNEFYTELKRLPSLFGGIAFSKSIKPKLVIQTGLSIQNFRFFERGTTEGKTQIHEYNENFWYMTMPINLIYKPGDYYLGAGLTISRFLQRRQIKDGTLSIINQPAYESILNERAYWMYGINLKAGKEWYLNNRYSFTTEIYGLAAQPSLTTQGLNSFGVRIGLMFGY